MIDSHCHLDMCDNPHDAADPTLKAMVSIGINVERSKNTIALAERYKNVWAAVGIHPNNASDANDPHVRSQIETLATHERVVAIGETGFDTYWDKETTSAQKDAFFWQIELAKKLDKAIILHVRDKQNAEDASLLAAKCLQEANYAKGILHCCNGHPALLQTGLELGWMVSFAGNVTYKSATVLQEAACLVPRERLMVETDSPYLAPVPKRGKRNQPGFVRHTAAFLAELRGEDAAVLEAYTDENAARIYGLPV